MDRSEVESILRGSREVDRMKRETAEVMGLLTSFATKVVDNDRDLLVSLKKHSKQVVYLESVNRTIRVEIGQRSVGPGHFKDVVVVATGVGIGGPYDSDPDYHVKDVVARYEALPQIVERFKRLFPGIDEYITPVLHIGKNMD